MYDLLIRRDPRDGNTIIPDLAHKWEVSPDGKKYTFHLRKGVKFHDGAEMTSADMKATYDRIVRPPKGVVIPRSSLFTAVGDIVTPDPYTIEFRLTEPRPRAFMLGAFASGWNIVVRKKTLDDNQGNLRQVMNFPGTGPFRHVSRKDKEVWIQEKNPNYWNKGLPYVDRLEIYNLPPFSPELGSSFLSGKVDYARIMDPVSWRKAKEMPGVTATAMNQSVIQAYFFNMKRKPFADPRVRRALHLATDRHVMVDVVKDTAPMQVGGFVYPFHEWSTPKAELEKRLGYQKDPKAAIQEAKKLMAAAGYPNGLKNLDFVVRDIASFKLWAVAIQAMLKENLNIESQPARGADLAVVRGGRRRQLRPGDQRDRLLPHGPVRLLHRLVRQGRPAELLAAGPTRQFHALAHSQIEREVDENKRKAMSAQGGGHSRERSAADPGGVGADLRRLVQPGARPEPDQVLRHLRRRALGHGLDGPVLGTELARVQKYLLRRGLFALGTLIGVSLIIFVVLRILPGDPLVALLGVEGHSKMTPADRVIIMKDLGLSDSLPVQYVRWLRDIASGQLGKSFFRGDTVRDLILHRGPLSRRDRDPGPDHLVAGGLPVGILSAVRPNGLRRRDHPLPLHPLHRDPRLLARHAAGAGAAVLVRLQVADHGGAALGEPLAEPPDHHRARHRARPRPGGLHRAHVALVPAGGHPRGLRAHRAGQGRAWSARWCCATPCPTRCCR